MDTLNQLETTLRGGYSCSWAGLNQVAVLVDYLVTEAF